VRPILFCTEFSDHAPNFFQYAVALGRALNTKIYAVHGFGKPDVRLTGDDRETKKKKVEDSLRKFVQENLPQGDPIEIEPLAVYGYPSEAVLEAAEMVDTDLLVIGMRGSDKPMERQIGSTAKEIMRKASRNLMILAIPSTIQFQDFKKISFFTRFEFKDLRALAVMIDLSNHFDSKLEILHVLEKGEDRAEAERNMDILRRILKPLSFVTFTITEGERRKVLQEHMQKEEVDLVGMISHKQTFLGGLIEGDFTVSMIGELSVPLLAFRT
jgi:nucleotide-binding universal stress UspA family protein